MNPFAQGGQQRQTVGFSQPNYGANRRGGGNNKNRGQNMSHSVNPFAAANSQQHSSQSMMSGLMGMTTTRQQGSSANLNHNQNHHLQQRQQQQQKICPHFLKGSCKFGKNCKFSHSAAAIGGQEQQMQQLQGLPQPQQGMSPFATSQQQVSSVMTGGFGQQQQQQQQQQQPFGFNQSSISMGMNNQMNANTGFTRQNHTGGQQQKVCKNFQQSGNCRFGNNCKFSHDLSGGGQGSSNFQYQQPQQTSPFAGGFGAGQGTGMSEQQAGQRMAFMQQTGFSSSVTQNQVVAVGENMSGMVDVDVDMHGGMNTDGSNGFQGSTVSTLGIPSAMTQAQQQETASKLENIDIAAALGAVTGDNGNEDLVDAPTLQESAGVEIHQAFEAGAAAMAPSDRNGDSNTNSDSAIIFTEELSDVPLPERESGLDEAPVVYDVWAAVEGAEYSLSTLPVPTLAPPRRDRVFA